MFRAARCCGLTHACVMYGRPLAARAGVVPRGVRPRRALRGRGVQLRPGLGAARRAQAAAPSDPHPAGTRCGRGWPAPRPDAEGRAVRAGRYRLGRPTPTPGPPPPPVLSRPVSCLSLTAAPRPHCSTSGRRARRAGPRGPPRHSRLRRALRRVAAVDGLRGRRRAGWRAAIQGRAVAVDALARAAVAGGPLRPAQGAGERAARERAASARRSVARVADRG
eukprot:4647545-Prymnesium_polylepis.1